MRRFHGHGDGRFTRDQFAKIGEHVVFEDGVRVWHPETIELGNNIYVGHDAMLKGYYLGRMQIGDDTWLGQGVDLHAAGGLTIGQRVGVGPFVKMITSYHDATNPEAAILDGELQFAATVIEDNADIGLGAIIIPGVRIGRGAQVAAGAVVTKDVEPGTVVAGNPAKLLRNR